MPTLSFSLSRLRILKGAGNHMGNQVIYEQCSIYLRLPSLQNLFDGLLMGVLMGFRFYLSYLNKKPPVLQFTCDTSRHAMFPIASSPVSVIAPETAHIAELTSSNKCFIAQKVRLS